MVRNKFLQPKPCANPDCLQKSFQPKRRDQKFCSTPCKDYFHNNRKRELLHKEYYRERIIKHNQRQLAGVYASPVYPTHEVPENILSVLQIKIDVCSDYTINVKTGQFIFWSHSYGVEIIPGRNIITYLIHKR